VGRDPDPLQRQVVAHTHEPVMTRHRLFPAIITREPETPRDQAITRPGAGPGTFLFLHQTAPALPISPDSHNSGIFHKKIPWFSHAEISGGSTRYEPYDREHPGHGRRRKTLL